jgi:biopolymer transport protein TolR
MAISGGALPSSGNKRSLDAEINLVPFIDLLSMCICFLLITAVWIQVGSVQVKQSKGTDAPAASQLLDLDVKFASPTAIDLLVQKSGRVVKKLSVQAATAGELPAKLDQSLGTLVAALSGGKAASPFGAAMLTPRPGVSYGDLVQVMDSLRRHQIINLGVVPVSER